MKFFRLDLLTLLISLFILNSCKNQDSVGLGIVSTNQGVGNLIDTSTVATNTILDDSVLTTGLSKLPMGYFNDPILGSTEVNVASNLNLPGGFSYALPSGTITIDSTRLILGFADGFYGDSLVSQYKVNVYQLNEQFLTTKTYYNTKSWDYNSSNILGSLTFNARTHVPIKIFHIIKGAPDTLIKVHAQIRIPINNSFITNNLFNANGTTLGSNDIFNQQIKGLYITIDKTKSTGPGGIFMLQPTDSLAVYYHTANGGTIDTAVTYLQLLNTAAQIKHTYSTAVQTELNNTTASRGIVYLQGLAGLRAKISFPHLLENLRKTLLTQGSDVVLNRAELVITPQPGSNIPYSPLPKITMYQLDLAHQRNIIQDASTNDPRAAGAPVFGGFYNPRKKEYHFAITAYLQDLLLKKTVDYGTYIAPIDSTESDFGVKAIPKLSPIAARAVVGGGADKTLPYSIKLNIIYTKIAK
jgi:hypothetical protein